MNSSGLRRSDKECLDGEIDLFDLWDSLVDQRKTVFLSFIGALLAAIVYLLVSGSKPEMYVAVATLQVQQVQLTTKNSVNRVNANFMSVERADRTIKLLSGAVPAKISSGSVGGYISISAIGTDKEKIKLNVENTVQVIKGRYQRIFSKLKSLGYVEILPAKVIGGIKVSVQPINQKKTLILAVAGVLGLMLGVMIALVRRAYRDRKARISTAG